MNTKYEKEISVPEDIKYEILGRAVSFFADSYPKNEEILWWKIPKAFELVITEVYRRGYAEGAGIKQIDPRQPGKND